MRHLQLSKGCPPLGVPDPSQHNQEAATPLLRRLCQTSATQWPSHLSSSCSMRCLKCSSSHAMDACTSTPQVASDT